MLTADVQGVYRADNHGWLFGWKSGYVFQAGPSKAMNWYSTSGSGGQSGAGTRAADGDAMCGNAVMYDAVNGKILSIGGAPNYQGTTATTNANIITINTPGTNPTVTKVANMAYQRIFANAVVLPNGEVFVTGGQTVGAPFSDANAILTPEMWDPATNTFTSMLPNSIPRTYHSIALLLPDATVLSGGGGLCGTCSTNHFDAQIYTPQYLLTSTGGPATRPVITSAPTSATLGSSVTVKTDSTCTSMSLIRMGSATHTVDTDQRRIPLSFTSPASQTYTFTIPSDPGIALKGYWMLFVMNSAGVPSKAAIIKLS
jgi:galactose oxidase